MAQGHRGGAGETGWALRSCPLHGADLGVSTCPSHAGHQHLAQSQSLVIFPPSLGDGGGEGCPLAPQSRGQAPGDGRQPEAWSLPNHDMSR